MSKQETKMLEFYIACGLMFIGLAWVGYHAMTDQDGLRDPDQRVSDLEKKVADLEKRVGNI